MRVAAVGFGEAGGRIVDRLLAAESRGESVVEFAMAVNTAKADLMALDRVPERNRVLIGEKRVKGHGVGADSELGASIAEEDIDEIQETLDSAPMHDIDAFLVVAGLGGGTGAGGSPVLAEHLGKIYTEPVYALGILPGSDEGGIYTLNAARQLPSLRERADATLLFDNAAWKEDDAGEYEQVNRELVWRLRGALTAPAAAEVAETLAEGGGVATIGFASDEVETGGDGLLSRFTGGDEPDVDQAQATNRITSLARKAALGRLTLPAEVSEATHASMVFDGPALYLNRKGVLRSRRWLEDEAGATVAATDAETADADRLSCTVVLAGLETCPRLEELEQVAAEAEADLEEVQEEAEEDLERLVEEDPDGEPAFGEATSGVDADPGTGSDGEDTPTSGTGPAPDAGPESGTATGGGAGSEPRTDTGADTDSSTGGSRTRPPSNAPAEVPTAPEFSITYDEIETVEPIGRGGNADVLRARVPGPDGEAVVALKEPRLDGTLHREAVERLLTEAETWSKLDDHDHVVGVVDYGAEPLPWIAMEYMDGGNLAERLANDDLAFAERRWIAIAVTRAVRQAHRRGVAHLDLKPENVLFRTVEDAWDVPKVADWGLSKHLLDHSRSVEGLSPGYAAPEQFDDEFGPADDITDIYGLGAVCYELFAGRPPFEGSPMEVMRSIVTEEPAPPSEVADVPPAVDEALQPALATERDDRYEDVIRLRDALEALPEEP